MASHEARVARVAAAVRTFHHRQEPFRIYHGSTNSTRPLPKDRRRIVDISALNNILQIDTKARLAIVEPNVPMDKLVQATLPYGLIPPVVMEFPGITVGGGYAGSAGESSSFQYGYFDETVEKVEMVLGNGKVVMASREGERSDLFKGAAGAVGSLGIVTLVCLRLVNARRYVRLVYRRTGSVRETVEVVKRETEEGGNDFVDAILFSKSHGVVMTGQLTDEKPTAEMEKRFSGPWDPWFYLHTKGISGSLESGEQTSDHIPIAEYLFRYDRGGFWVGLEAFKYFGGLVPFTRATRWFLDDFLHTRMLYRALHGSKASMSYMVQDLSLPYPSAAKFIHYTAEKLDIWPLWLCPLRETEPPTFHPYTRVPGPGREVKPMLNVGVWGRAAKDVETFVRQNRELEHKLTSLGGRKVLYSHTYYTEREFWEIYDKSWYDALRKKYFAESLPTVFDKVSVDAENMNARRLPWFQQLRWSWPFAGVVGIWQAIRSKDYLLHRDVSWMKQEMHQRSEVAREKA